MRGLFARMMPYCLAEAKKARHDGTERRVYGAGQVHGSTGSRRERAGDLGAGVESVCKPGQRQEKQQQQATSSAVAC